MLSEREDQERLDRIQALRQQVTDRLSGSLVSNPALAEELNKQIDELLEATTRADEAVAPPPDRGLAELVGVGPEAAKAFGHVKIPLGVEPYDENVNSERIVAVGDLYYIYQHERIGVFRVVQKLKELFEAGAIRLSGGEGAYRLYQFDRRDVLRYTKNDRTAAYRRVLGYGRGLGAAWYATASEPWVVIQPYAGASLGADLPCAPGSPCDRTGRLQVSVDSARAPPGSAPLP